MLNAEFNYQNPFFFYLKCHCKCTGVIHSNTTT